MNSARNTGPPSRVIYLSAPSGAIVSAYLAHGAQGHERRFRSDRDWDHVFGGPGSADGQRLVTSTASAAGESAFRGEVCAGQGAQARAQQVDDLLRARGGECVRVEQVP
jgi:hypothetical protein